MQELKGKRILIFQQRGWALNIGHFLAKKLQAEGCRLAALTLKQTTHEFVLNQKEVNFEMISNIDEIKKNPRKYLDGYMKYIFLLTKNLGIMMKNIRIKRNMGLAKSLNKDKVIGIF